MLSLLSSLSHTTQRFSGRNVASMATTLSAASCSRRRRSRAWRRTSVWTVATLVLCVLALASVSVESIVTRDDAAASATASFSTAPTYPPVTSAAPSSSSPISHAPAPTTLAATVETPIKAAEAIVSTAPDAATAAPDRSTADAKGAAIDARDDRTLSSSSAVERSDSTVVARPTAEASDVDAALPTAAAPVAATQTLAPLDPSSSSPTTTTSTSSSASSVSGRVPVQVTELVADEVRTLALAVAVRRSCLSRSCVLR